MKIESIVIPATNDFASLYIEQKEPVKDFFHYDITENSVFNKRYKDLMDRNYNRENLALCIGKYMDQFPPSSQSKQSLEKLKKDESVVVIGGQQAGLLTGPLYTIHKIISIIKLAEKQESELGVPVVPVFWIAGEDHDYLEVNHINVESNGRVKKLSFQSNSNEKKMASDIHYDKEKLFNWAKTIFEYFGERTYTKEWIGFLESAIESNNTITDFFTHIVMYLFRSYGLLVIDAAYPELRKLEEPFFRYLIHHNTEITRCLFEQQQIIGNHGFGNMIEVDRNSANLFYYEDHERNLLQYNEREEVFTSPKISKGYTKDELYQLLSREPEHFSNNVVTRPLMQEWLFPTLAFIGGPGEIAYWGELKKTFEYVGMQMPPIIPRLNITFLDSRVEKDIVENQLTVEDVLKDGVQDAVETFLANQRDQELHESIEELSLYIDSRYKSILERMTEKEPGLLPIIEKNLSFHRRQLEYLIDQADSLSRNKHEAILNKYKRIDLQCRPNGAPQERVWNIFYYLNIHGKSFLDQLMSLHFDFDGKHKIIKY